MYAFTLAGKVDGVAVYVVHKGNTHFGTVFFTELTVMELINSYDRGGTHSEMDRQDFFNQVALSANTLRWECGRAVPIEVLNDFSSFVSNRACRTATLRDGQWIDIKHSHASITTQKLSPLHIQSSMHGRQQ